MKSRITGRPLKLGAAEDHSDIAVVPEEHILVQNPRYMLQPITGSERDVVKLTRASGNSSCI